MFEGIRQTTLTGCVTKDPDQVLSYVGLVRDGATADDLTAARSSTSQLLACTQRLALRLREKYLLSSAALSELAVFVDVA